MLNRTEVIIYIEPEDNSTEDSPNNDDNIINDTIMMMFSYLKNQFYHLKE